MNLDAWRHTLRGRLALLLHRRERAAAEYRAALRADPAAAAPATRLAWLLAGQGRDGEAIAIYRDFLQRRPRDADAWFNLGFLLDRRQENEPAIEAFREAVRINARLDRAWYGLGLVLARAGRPREAVEAFERVVQLQPMNGHAFYQLGMALHAAGEADKIKGIVEHLDRFERRMARQLIQDSGRSDLAHIVADLRDLNSDLRA
jgi:tetratricopeptide (TPR) repeat protein